MLIMIAESFIHGGWHIQRAEKPVHANDDSRATALSTQTECGITFIPRNISHTANMTGVCRLCQRERMIRVGDTTYRSLPSLDVGFDLRLQEMEVVLPDDPDISVDTDHCLYAGPRDQVIREMTRDGWRIANA